MGGKGTAAIRAAAQMDLLLQASALEVPPALMAHAEHRGILERIIPGVYLGCGHARHPLAEAAAWTVRFPAAVVCMLTAAAYHDLTDAFERGTWLFLPEGSSRPRSRTVDVNVILIDERFVRLGDDDVNGIMPLRVHGVNVRITGPDRTVLDLWRYPRRVSTEHAIEALRRRTCAPDFHIPVFARLARHLGVWSRIESLLQGLMLR